MDTMGLGRGGTWDVSQIGFMDGWVRMGMDGHVCDEFVNGRTLSSRSAAPGEIRDSLSLHALILRSVRGGGCGERWDLELVAFRTGLVGVDG